MQYFPHARDPPELRRRAFEHRAVLEVQVPASLRPVDGPGNMPVIAHQDVPRRQVPMGEERKIVEVEESEESVVRPAAVGANAPSF